MITIEDLKDFYIWKQWKNGEVELGEPEFKTKPGFVEKDNQVLRLFLSFLLQYGAKDCSLTQHHRLTQQHILD